MRNIYWLVLSGVIIFLDQISKILAVNYLTFQTPKIIIPRFFNLYLDFNQGAAFSFLSQSGHWAEVSFLLLAAGVGLICFIFLLTQKNNAWKLNAGLACLMGGALGNGLDRLRLGHVVDFIQWYFGYWGNYFWPTFNLADSAICMGVGLIIWGEFFKNKNKKILKIRDKK